MLTSTLQDQRRIEQDLIALGDLAFVKNPRDAFALALEAILPAESIATKDWARKHRKIEVRGKVLDYDPVLTPYNDGIMDACDEFGVREVAVKGPARAGKTIGAENVALNRWSNRPGRVLWYMQTGEDMEDYMEERGEWMIDNHPRVAARLIRDRRTSLTRKRIGGHVALFRAATLKTTRGKAAPLVIADEIDGYSKRVRKAILTLIRNRQREFGNDALAFICSHPDAGPTEGIDAVLAEAIVHLWWMNCPKCHKASSPCAESDIRITWNVSALLENIADTDPREVRDMVREKARLVCPHCNAQFDNRERLAIMRKGCWLQPHQKLDRHGVIQGKRRLGPTMGFVIHGFMAPFVDLGDLAAEYALAKISADNTGDATNLKEVVVKSLGETFEGARAEEQVEDYRVLKQRLATPYPLKTVPLGVDFLTAFVDVQGDRFEVRVVGWRRNIESYLVDVFSIKQWPNGDNVDPANRLRDWDLIEHRVLDMSWPLATNKGDDDDLFLSVARTAIDMGGAGGADEGSTVSNNAKLWVAKITDPARRGRLPVPGWRIQLQRGAASKHQAEIYGTARQVAKDDQGRALLVPVFERTVNVHSIKKIIARRMKIPEGPGAMHAPSNLSDRYWRELSSERLVNDEWVATGRNETWDGWVAAEVARYTLRPDRQDIDWANDRPVWATPAPRGEDPGTGPSEQMAARPQTYYDRLAELNSDVEGDLGHGSI
jgi:phage terminase large subunit GpA-like protein